MYWLKWRLTKYAAGALYRVSVVPKRVRWRDWTIAFTMHAQSVCLKSCQIWCDRPPYGGKFLRGRLTVTSLIGVTDPHCVLIASIHTFAAVLLYDLHCLFWYWNTANRFKYPVHHSYMVLFITKLNDSFSLPLTLPFSLSELWSRIMLAGHGDATSTVLDGFNSWHWLCQPTTSRKQFTGLYFWYNSNDGDFVALCRVWQKVMAG